MSRIQRNVGFGGRKFLEQAEWLAYCRRKPVRYIRTVKANECHICKMPGSPENPLQNAHRIGFDVGVMDLGLTPEFLDSDENIVTAHRRTCNRQSELDLCGSMRWLRDLGVTELPHYLPAAIQEAWRAAAGGKLVSTQEENWCQLKFPQTVRNETDTCFLLPRCGSEKSK